MTTITPTELRRRLNAESKLTVFDVRTPAEYARAHVSQAQNQPLEALEPKALYADGRLLEGETVYLLCQAGARAAKAAEKFAQAGYQNAVVVEGGTQRWIEEGLPVERGTSKVISLERQVRIGAGSFVLAGVILSALVHPYFIFVSGFVGAGLIFAGITDWCGMGLLLAKAPWNQRPG